MNVFRSKGPGIDNGAGAEGGLVVEMEEETQGREVKRFLNGGEVQMKAGTCTPELLQQMGKHGLSRLFYTILSSHSCSGISRPKGRTSSSRPKMASLHLR